MALSTLAKEQENFLRYAILIVDHSKEALQDLVELNLKNKHLPFDEFLNQNQHEIYHLCYDSRCCQCQNTPPRRKRIIFPSQLELLFDKYKTLPSHRGIGHNDFCCSYAKVGITSQVLDLSLARCLLVNCCLDVFWFTSLTSHSQTLEQFLNSNKHTIYHLWKNNQNCCQCKPGFIFPCNDSLITENEWKSMFSSLLSPCENDRKRMSTGSSSVCSVGATPGIATQNINPEIQRFILQKCSHISKAVDFLVEQRNLRFAHVPEAKIPDSDFRLFLKDIETHLLGISRVCGKETHVKNILRDLHLKPLSLNMLRKYEKLLHKNMEAINKNVNLQHRTTRQSIPRLVDKSSKIRRIEERVDALETSVAAITEEVKDLSKIIKDRSKRQRLIDQTSAEIEIHEKDVPYVEIEALRHCIKLLESRNVVVLTGREGSGKSRNGLEILRQFKERHKDSDVFKLIGLHYVSDIVKCNVTSIVLFDDAFDKTCEQFANDKHILDHLYSYITLNKVKLIFTMRNTVRHACNRLLSTHRLFHDLLDINLNSEKFKLTKVEKEKILTNYCDINKIKIFERVGDKTNQSVFHEAGIDNKETIQTVSDQVFVFVNREMIDEIIQTDPFLGFPECCRLFTEHRNNTTLDATIFKWPSHTLVKDIEKWRIEGKHDSVNGLKYVALICILLSMGKSHDIDEYYLGSNFKTVYSLHEKNIDVKGFNEIFQECCNKNSEVYEHDIKYALDELVAGCYLVKKDETYHYQHPALKDTGLVSYGKINTKAIIPLLSLDHMMDLVKLQNYIEQENEIFIRIQKKYYYDLAIHFISLIRHKYGIRLMECSTFTKSDIDFIHQLLLCFNDKSETSLMLKLCDNGVSNYFPLCLLRNIGELDDNKLTANHTQDELLISMVIEGQTTPFVVDPSESLLCALQEKNEQIIIWLAKNTDHSLLDFDVVYEYIFDTNLGSIPLLLQNFDHDQFDMTDLLLNVCICYSKEENHILDWMMDNINNSLIDYDDMFEQFFDLVDLEKYFNLILHIRNKVNRKLFDVSKAVKFWFINMGIEIVQRVLQDGDNKILDEEELIDIMIDYCEQKSYIYMHEKHDEDNEKIVEQLLQTNGVKYHDLSKLVAVASDRGWLNVIELIFKHDADKSFHTDNVIKDALQQPGNGAYNEETIRLIMKYYVDYIDVDILMERAIDGGFHRVVKELLVKKVDNVSFYLDIAIYKLMCQPQTFHFTGFVGKDQDKIVEQLLLATGVKYRDLNILVSMAYKGGWLNVLDLLFKHDFDKSFLTHTIIEDALQQLGNRGHCQETIPLIIKYYIDYIDVNIMMKKAIDVGCHRIVEELLVKKVDKISYYLDITLHKLRHQQLNSFLRSGNEKILLLLLKKINTKCIDLNSVMNDVCHIGHSSAILWLLENKPSHCFDLRNVMNKASYHGHRELVEYLKQNYKAADFDYKTAMIKACRNSQEETLDVCKWLWANIDRDLFDMKVALNNASRCNNTKVVGWIFTDVDEGLLDIESAVFCASEHGGYNIVDFLLDNSSITCIDMIDFEHAISLACKNENCYSFQITKRLYERADKSTVDINVVFSVACKNYRSDIVQWLIETCDQNIIVTETGDGNRNFINSFDKHLLDISLAMNFIVDMDPPKHKIKNVEATKNNLLCIILKKFHLKTIDLNKLLTESCKKNWLEIFICLLGKMDHSFLNIREAINVACQCGALNIVKWSLQNIDVKLFDIENVMVESCAYGWLECLVLIQKQCYPYDFNVHQSMVEACTYGRLEIVEWLLQNVNNEFFHLPLLLQEAGRNGWMNIIYCLVNTFQLCTSDLHVATHEALSNGHLQIVEWMVSVLGKDCIAISSVADKIYLDSGNEAVVTFILQHFDPKVLDIASVFTNACKFGWKDTTSFILDNDVSSLCDFNLAFNKACDNGETEIVKLLLEKVDHQILDVKKAMQSVAVKGWDEIAVLVLDNVQHTRLDIGNALIEACKHGEIDVVQAILQKVERNMLDVKTALNKACVNHMHEELVLWILENIDQEQVDLKRVKKQAFRHKWWKVQFELAEIGIEDLNQDEQETETDNIVILE